MRLETRYIDIGKSISIIDRNFHIDFISTISIIYGNTSDIIAICAQKWFLNLLLISQSPLMIRLRVLFPYLHDIKKFDICDCARGGKTVARFGDVCRRFPRSSPVVVSNHKSWKRKICRLTFYMPNSLVWKIQEYSYFVGTVDPFILQSQYRVCRCHSEARGISLQMSLKFICNVPFTALQY